MAENVNAVINNTPSILLTQLEKNIQDSEHLCYILRCIRLNRRIGEHSKHTADRWAKQLLKTHPKAFPRWIRGVAKSSIYLTLRDIRSFIIQKAVKIQRWIRFRLRIRNMLRTKNPIINEVDAFTLEPVSTLSVKLWLKAPPSSSSSSSDASVHEQPAFNHEKRWYVFDPVSMVQYIMKSGNITNPFNRKELTLGEQYTAMEYVFRNVSVLAESMRNIIRSRMRTHANAKVKSLLECIAQHRKHEIAERANRVTATRILIESVMGQARSILRTIETVESRNRPFRVFHRGWEMNRPTVENRNRMNIDRHTLPRRPPFREYRGPEWSRQNDGIILNRSGIRISGVLNTLDSLVFGLTYLRDSDVHQFEAVQSQIYCWLYYMQQSNNIMYGPTARRIAQRVAYRLVIRGIRVPVLDLSVGATEGGHARAGGNASRASVSARERASRADVPRTNRLMVQYHGAGERGGREETRTPLLGNAVIIDPDDRGSDTPNSSSSSDDSAFDFSSDEDMDHNSTQPRPGYNRLDEANTTDASRIAVHANVPSHSNPQNMNENTGPTRDSTEYLHGFVREFF